MGKLIKKEYTGFLIPWWAWIIIVPLCAPFIVTIYLESTSDPYELMRLGFYPILAPGITFPIAYIALFLIWSYDAVFYGNNGLKLKCGYLFGLIKINIPASKIADISIAEINNRDNPYGDRPATRNFGRNEFSDTLCWGFPKKPYSDLLYNPDDSHKAIFIRRKDGHKYLIWSKDVDETFALLKGHYPMEMEPSS